MGEGAAHGIEEHEVARFQVLAANLVTQVGHFARSAWQIQAYRVAENVEHQSAAIESGRRRSAAEAVTNAEVGEGLVDQLLRSIGVFTDYRTLSGLGRLCLFRLFGGAGELGRREQDCEGEKGRSQKHSAKYTQATVGCKQKMSDSRAARRTFFTARKNQILSFWRNAL